MVRCLFVLIWFGISVVVKFTVKTMLVKKSMVGEPWSTINISVLITYNISGILIILEI